MKIPLPGLLRQLRRQQFESGFRPAPVRYVLQAWAALAKRARLYHPLMRIAIALLAQRRSLHGESQAAERWPDDQNPFLPSGNTSVNINAEVPSRSSSP